MLAFSEAKSSEKLWQSPLLLASSALGTRGDLLGKSTGKFKQSHELFVSINQI